MTVAIRRAVEDDLETLRVLLRETWHATYDEFHGAADVERRGLAALGPEAETASPEMLRTERRPDPSARDGHSGAGPS